MGNVNVTDMRNAASHLDDAWVAIRDWVPSDVAEVSSALAGGASDGAAATLATTWAEAFDALATRIDNEAAKYRTAADAWEEMDRAAAERFAPMTEGPR